MALSRRALRRATAVLRRPARRAFDRHQAVRELAALAAWPRLRRDAPDLAHLAFFDERVVGPVQRDEALLLHGLIRVLRPQTVVEIGFAKGESAFNLLRAMDSDARLYLFDIKPRCAEIARERFGHDPRSTFYLRSQTDLRADDLDGRPADFVFLDASHDLALNQTTFAQLQPLMAPDAILADHDTGTVPRELFPDWHWRLNEPANWVGDQYEGQPGERAFVNWVLEEQSGSAQLHLHSRRTIRNGITLLQRSAPLPPP